MDRSGGSSARDDERSATAASGDGSDGQDQTESRASDPSGPRLVSRVLVTWIELTVVGITGGLLGVAVGGPPGFIVHLATTLLTVGIVFYNVNELVREWVQATIENA